MKGCMSTDLGIVTIDPEVVKVCRYRSSGMFWHRGDGDSEYEGWAGPSVEEGEPDQGDHGGDIR